MDEEISCGEVIEKAFPEAAEEFRKDGTLKYYYELPNPFLPQKSKDNSSESIVKFQKSPVDSENVSVKSLPLETIVVNSTYMNFNTSSITFSSSSFSEIVFPKMAVFSALYKQGKFGSVKAASIDTGTNTTVVLSMDSYSSPESGSYYYAQGTHYLTPPPGYVPSYQIASTITDIRKY